MPNNAEGERTIPSLLVGAADGLHSLNGDGSVKLAGREVGTLAKDASGWWAVVSGAEVWRTDGENDWALMASMETFRANCLLPTPNGLFVGTSESHLFSLRDGKLRQVDSFEETEGRETWHTPWGGPPDVRSMSADPNGVLYANVHVGRVLKSRDGGKSWEPTIEVNADVHHVLFDAGSNQLLAATARGLAVSADEGETWRFDVDGLHGRYLRSVAVAGETVLVTASTGPFTERAAVYRRPVGGDGTFERCASGLPEWFASNIDTYWLAASDSLAALGTSAGDVFVSTDEGRTWSASADGLPPIRCVAIP